MAERLIYLPLGGAGEIGMNAYVYGYGQPGRERLIVVETSRPSSTAVPIDFASCATTAAMMTAAMAARAKDQINDHGEVRMGSP